MKFGLIWALRNPAPWQKPFPQLYRETLEEIKFAESLGYDSVWLTEHHFCDDGYLPAIMPALAAIAARTTTIRIGVYVLLMPFHNPIRLAEDAAVVDIISNGRLELAIGVGYRAEEFAGFGIPRSIRGQLHGEGVEVLLKAWSDAPLDFEGRQYRFHNVPVTPKPVQKPGPPVYLGGVSLPVLERIARLPVTGVAGRPYPNDMPAFLAALAANGRDPATIDYLPFMFMWVHRDGAEAKRIAAPFADWVIGHYARWFAEAGNPILNRAPEEECAMGDPEHCIKAIEAFLDRGAHVPPIRRLLIQPPLLGVDHQASMDTIETFAMEVAPHFAEI